MMNHHWWFSGKISLNIYGSIKKSSYLTHLSFIWYSLGMRTLLTLLKTWIVRKAWRGMCLYTCVHICVENETEKGVWCRTTNRKTTMKEPTLINILPMMIISTWTSPFILTRFISVMTNIAMISLMFAEMTYLDNDNNSS